MEQNKHIKNTIKVLDQNIKYYEVTMSRESQYLQGFKKATEVAKWCLEPALLPEPLHGEAWLIEIFPECDDSFTANAIRDEERGYWETLEDRLWDSTNAYRVVPITNLVPKEDK